MLHLLLIAALSLITARAMGAGFVLYTYHDKPPHYLHAESNIFAHETDGDANNLRMLLSHRVNATRSTAPCTKWVATTRLSATATRSGPL